MTKVDIIKNIIVLILLVCFIIWRKLDKTTMGQVVLNDIKEDQFHGKVDSVFHDLRDHNTKKVKLTTGYVYGLYPDWESMVEKGDSLDKKKGAVIVEVYKLNGVKINLDYRILAKGFKE
jgi:tetrahydromethanopterin S-methyltransferase subunit G